VSLDQPPPPELRAALVAAIPERKARDALTRELDRFELRHRTFASPSQRGVAFRPLPLLCVRDAQGELELAERETLLDLAGFVLADQPPELPGFAPTNRRAPTWWIWTTAICASSRSAPLTRSTWTWCRPR
jgi:hypothetical protein